jgi:hypothetical protein
MTGPPDSRPIPNFPNFRLQEPACTKKIFRGRTGRVAPMGSMLPRKALLQQLHRSKGLLLVLREPGKGGSAPSLPSKGLLLVLRDASSSSSSCCETPPPPPPRAARRRAAPGRSCSSPAPLRASLPHQGGRRLARPSPRGTPRPRDCLDGRGASRSNGCALWSEACRFAVCRALFDLMLRARADA